MASIASKAMDALGKAISDRDADQIADLWADDIVVWHGATGVGQSKQENVGLLAGVFAVTSELQYTDIVRHEFEGGLVQQHKLTGKFDDGSPTPSLAACLVVLVNDEGKFTRIDEYFDASHFAAVFERLEALSASNA